MAAGRPSKYTQEFAVQAEKLCRLGATNRELGDFFNVDTRTIERWASEHEEFCRSIKTGKEVADDRVERSLYHRANGYEHSAVKIFMPSGAEKPVYAPYVEHVPPDTTAAIFWLKNRRPEQWRDKHDHDVNVGVTVELVRYTDTPSVQLGAAQLPAPSVVRLGEGDQT